MDAGKIPSDELGVISTMKLQIKPPFWNMASFFLSFFFIGLFVPADFMSTEKENGEKAPTIFLDIYYH